MESKKLKSAQAREQLSLSLYQSTQPAATGFVPDRFGTFQDNLRAPIHRWFKYPAGFSYKLVETFIEDYKLGPHSWLLDPFAGCGTTPVTAKQYGVNSIGIELHPFVYWVAKIKCFWEYELDRLYQNIQKLLSLVHQTPPFPGKASLKEFPDLVHKCYSGQNLWALKFIRDSIETFNAPDEEKDFFRLALTDTLRGASAAGTGWPYVAPSKYQAKNERPALEVFSQTLQEMYKDLVAVSTTRARPVVQTKLLLMDTRQPYPIEAESVDLVVTSPPYLNNYDYADRTRLELYFFGWAKSWGEITAQIRDKLIISATTQTRRSDFANGLLSTDLRDLDPKLYQELTDKVSQLSKKRLEKGGKKSYDLMVAGYFNDMHQVLKQIYRTLKSGATCALVLGDSAPYGVHIPTEEYLGRLGLAYGFRDYQVQNLRERGNKWKNNPQRHKVMLKEGILLLQK